MRATKKQAARVIPVRKCASLYPRKCLLPLTIRRSTKPSEQWINSRKNLNGHPRFVNLLPFLNSTLIRAAPIINEGFFQWQTYQSFSGKEVKLLGLPLTKKRALRTRFWYCLGSTFNPEATPMKKLSLMNKLIPLLLLSALATPAQAGPIWNWITGRDDEWKRCVQSRYVNMLRADRLKNARWCDQYGPSSQYCWSDKKLKKKAKSRAKNVCDKWR